MITEDLEKFYPKVNKTEDIKISDDIKQNILTTVYNYEVDGFWQDGDKLNVRGFIGFSFIGRSQTWYQVK